MAGRLLITGADGFTGHHLAHAAGSRGFEVTGLTADLTDNDALRAELSGKGFEHVVHLAAISAVTHSDELALYRVNLFGTLALMQALLDTHKTPPRVVVASSANIYGNSPNSPLTEDTHAAPVNHYAMSKLAMEHMLQTFREELPIIVARPFNYTGRGHDERFVVPKIVRHYRERAARIELGNLDVEREFNDVRTICSAYLALLDKGRPGETYNLCSGRTHTLADVMQALETLTGHHLEHSVNRAFVRDNEVRRLCGDPARLEACIGELSHPALADTLGWMLG